MSNVYADRWVSLHAGEKRDERVLANMEAAHSRAQGTEVCGNCGGTAYHRPGVGAFQCTDCRAVLALNGEWR
jgi:ribosomal protein L37AE/L43A